MPMKTTEKYADKVKQVTTSVDTSSNQDQTTATTSPTPYPRDIILMRIHQILKSARDE